MGRYRIVVRKPVSKDLDGIPKREIRRTIKAIAVLSDDPRPVQSRKLSGEEKWRLRRGVFRIVYEILDAQLVVCVVKIRHRKDAYR